MKMNEKLRFIFRRYGAYISFKNSWSDDMTTSEVEYMRRSLIKTNIDRTFLASVGILLVTLVYEIYGLIQPDAVTVSAAERITDFVLLTATSVFGYVYMFNKIYRRIITEQVKWITMLFWYWIGILMVLILPNDSFTEYGIVNYMAYLSLVSILPIFEAVEIVPFTIVLFLLQSASMIIAGAAPMDLAYCLIYTICAVLMSRISFNAIIAAEKSSSTIGEFANHDQLTKLLNRHGFDLWLDEHREEFLKKPSACGFIDIDFFKQYNDTFGHLQGDECLKMVSECIRSRFETRGNAVFRFGGEEFVVLLFNAAPEEAEKEFVALKAAVEKIKMETARKDVSQYVTVSIGYTCRAVGEPFDPDTIIAEADKALYAAKQRSRNTVCRYGENNVTL